MTAIILAAGMGTRIGNLTESVPKCLLPFENSTILETSIKKLKNANIENILIVAGYKSNLIQAIYNNVVINSDYETTQPPHSLRLGLEKIETPDDILILDGDLIFEKNLISDVLKNKNQNKIVVYKATSQNESGSRVETNKKNRILNVGRYISPTFPYYINAGILFIKKSAFITFKNLICRDTYKKTEMHTALNDFCKIKSMFIFDTEDYNIKKEKSKQRLDGGSFANLKISKEKNIIIKETSTDVSRLINEISYLKNLRTTLKPYFVQLLSYKIDKKNNYATYTMPLYREKSLKKLILSGKITTRQSMELILGLLSFMKNNVYSLNQTMTNLDNYVESVHLYRFYARKEITIKKAPIFKKIFQAKKIIINSVEYDNLQTVVNKISLCPSLIKFLTPKKLCLIHGDLHFDNILVNIDSLPYRFRLIDPKGFSAGDPMYDVSKLLHDFNGLYDFIYEYMFSLNYKITNDILTASLNVTSCKALSEFTKLNSYLPIEMNKILTRINKNWYYQAKFIEAINFSCLQPYHLVGDKKQNKAVAMYLIGVILLNNFWDSLPIHLKIVKRKYNVININTVEDFTYAKNLFSKNNKFPGV